MGRSAPGSRTGLLRIVWPFVAVVVLQAGLASLSLYTLSAVRAYVGGESFWSKGQKDAIYYLDLYANTGDEAYYHQYSKAIAIPLADRSARLELDDADADLDRAARFFRWGDNHTADTGGLIWLYRNFKDFIYLRRAIDIWIEGDEAVAELMRLADRIRADVRNGNATPAMRELWGAQIHDINRHIADVSRAFSRSLGEGSRFIASALLAMNLLTAAILILIGVWRTRNLYLQRRSFETALQAEKERIATTLASIGQAVFTVDVEGRLDYMNAAAERLVGVSANAALGRPLDTLFRLEDPHQREDRSDAVRLLAKGATVDATGAARTLLRSDGVRVAVSLTGAPLLVDGTTAGAVVVLHDMTREQEYIAQLSWQATHDGLTNLANRREFERQATEALRALADTGVGFALLYVDLDQFKIVNDTCGHAAGDQLLRQLADFLRRRLPSSNLLARLGGDEFGILMPDCDAEGAWQAAEKLRIAVEEMAFAWKDRGFTITVSVGLAYVSDHATTLAEALRAADVACYTAKENGRNRVQLHTPSDSDLLRKFGEMAWVQRIRDALDDDRFCLDQQEITALQPGDTSGRHVELLLRLRDVDGSLVPPAVFMPPAERYSLMPAIDRWVVDHALATLANIQRGDRPIATCAINLSGATLGDPSFVGFMTEQFRRHDVEPSVICLEITETSAIANLDSATRFIEALKDMGCRFSLDDFGAGMSSFAYLKHLPVDFLKIDGTFVRDILRDPIDRAMVETIHRIGKLMGKLTIAEFVESTEIADALRGMGVDYAQGFGIARPVRFSADTVANRPAPAGAEVATSALTTPQRRPGTAPKTPRSARSA